MPGLGGYKYTACRAGPKLGRILGGASTPALVHAAYAASTWNKVDSALNTFENFCKDCNVTAVWPLNQETVNGFIHWCTFVRKLSPNTITSYMSHLKMIHNLRGVDDSSCTSFLSKAQIRGAKNLKFYSEEKSQVKKVMTLPLLKILGHSIAISNWSNRSKIVLWSAFCTAFFGSFRLGELLPKHENSFNKFECLLWSDIKFFDDESVQIHVKIPKTRNPNGEIVSLFRFPNENCCPIEALKCLLTLSKCNVSSDIPVFSFESGKYLTIDKMNMFIVKFLEPFIGDDAKFYSCKSFRAALPSALATFPHIGNDVSIKRWGRWNSDAFERYTRLSHAAKKELFERFANALRSNYNI
jgi:hypothetical protein